MPHTIPHLADRVRQTSEALAAGASRDLVGDYRPATPVRVNEVIGELGVCSRALSRGDRLIDESEIAAWERRLARCLTRPGLTEPFGDDIHDFGGHDTVGRQLAAGDADDAVGAV